MERRERAPAVGPAGSLIGFPRGSHGRGGGIASWPEASRAMPRFAHWLLVNTGKGRHLSPRRRIGRTPRHGDDDDATGKVRLDAVGCMILIEDKSARPIDADPSASFPLDVERGLRGKCGAAFLDHVLNLIAVGETRSRGLSEQAAKQRRRTVEVLLANLVAAALNRLNPRRFVGVSFRRGDYAKLGISCDAMTLSRNAMLGAGLIELVRGFHDPAYKGIFEAGRVTRIRGTDALRDLLGQFGVSRHTVAVRRERLIRLKHPRKDAGPEPLEVTNSRDVLARINARIDGHDVDLPEDAWDRLKERAVEASDDNIPFVGDPTAKALYRVFTGDWTRGGRLYGAWWLNTPKIERRHLTIDGEPTVEIDFGHLHPALLYRAMNKPCDVDPYGLPPYSRDLCKETFQRLINGSIRKGGADLKRPKKQQPPHGIPFTTFLADYKLHLHAVASCFGRNVGLILQWEDSNLALAILDEMDRQGIATLPIHDSFMVKACHEHTLHLTMSEVYRGRYGIEATLKVSHPTPSGPPPGALLEPVSAACA